MMVRIDDENSYMVDFFRIKGGKTHTYSLHASSNEILETVGLELDPQDATPGDGVLDEGGYIGSYAGPNEFFGDNAAFTNGFSWITM
jgi:hypothetical protein